jgi:hypothetical protein
MDYKYTADECVEMIAKGKETWLEEERDRLLGLVEHLQKELALSRKAYDDVSGEASVYQNQREGLRFLVERQREALGRYKDKLRQIDEGMRVRRVYEDWPALDVAMRGIRAELAQPEATQTEGPGEKKS